MTCPTTYDNIYVVVDIDGQRALLRDVTSSFVPGKNITKVDVTDANIIFPANSGVYIGYGITRTKQGDNMIMGYGMETEWKNACYTNKDFLTSSSWAEMRGYGENNYLGLIISFEVTAAIPVTFGDMGIAYIKEGDGGSLEVVPAAGKTVYEIEWYRNNSLVVDTTPSGSYMARLTYYDGTSERVYYKK